MIIDDNTKVKIDNRMTYKLSSNFYENKRVVKLSTPKENKDSKPLFILKV